ncbi:MAG: hypothetical protein P8L66_09190 [Rhodospirillaceae bacterium]|nr:hypothetical protein [Rhodospirillaceae bacterium]
MNQMTEDALLENLRPLPDKDTTEDLKTAELLALWTIRAWVQNSSDKSASSYHFQDGLEKAGCADAAVSFAALLEIIGSEANRRIEIHTTGCPCLFPDEKRILHTLAALQTGHALEAFDVLKTLLSGAVVRIALEHAGSVAAILSRVGLHLPDRAWHLKELLLTNHLRAPRTNATFVRYQLH